MASMKPAFAIVDWDMFVVPVLAYMGPDEIPDFIRDDVRSKVAKSRYSSFLSVDGILGQIADIDASSQDANARALTEGDDGLVPFVRIWTYSDAILAHEVVHVVQGVCEHRGIRDREFFAYAVEWLFGDLREALTGKWQNAIHFRRH